MDQARDMVQTNDVDRSNSYSPWLCRVQLDTSYEMNQAWPQLSSQNKGKHSSQRNEQHCKKYHRYVPYMNLDTSFEDGLDLSEYPELGDKKIKSKNKSDHSDLSNKMIITPYREGNEKYRKVNGQNRFKRTGRISFNFENALEIAQHYALKQQEELQEIKLNTYRVNTDPRKNLTSDMTIKIRKVKTYFLKPKKPSTLKQKILLERLKAKFEENRMKKMKGNAIDVNSINFNTLTIKSDPEIDVDYVKRMSTLTVYDTNYRDSKMENVSEDTVQYRPDLTQKLDNLQISNILNRNISTRSYRNALDNTDDLNILQNTLSLKSEDDIDHKPDIKPLFSRYELIKYSKNFREYCNNLITPSLNETLEKFLSEIKRLQTKLYDRDQKKGKYRRRYYVGLKEVQMHVALKKIRFVVIAPDIEKVQSEGGLDDEIDKLLEVCRKNETVFCFGLRRRKLGYYAHGNGFVSCIGIANYGNAEELFLNVLVEVIEARTKFEELRGRSERTIDVSKIIYDNGLLSENIGILLKTLSSIN